MLAALISVLLTLRDCLRARAALHVELLALRHDESIRTAVPQHQPLQSERDIQKAQAL
jgi:hypothetical protein